MRIENTVKTVGIGSIRKSIRSVRIVIMDKERWILLGIIAVMFGVMWFIAWVLDK